MGAPQFLIELSTVLVAVVNVDLAPIDFDCLPDHEIMGSEEFPIRSTDFLSFEENALRHSRVLFFLFVHGDRVIFQVEQDLDFSISGIFSVAFYNRLLEEAVKSEDMPIKTNPVRLVELARISGVFGVEVVMGCGFKGVAWWDRLPVFFFPRQGVESGFDIVNIPVELLLGGTDFPVMFFELLGGSKPGEKGVIGSHVQYKFCNL